MEVSGPMLEATTRNGGFLTFRAQFDRIEKCGIVISGLRFEWLQA